MKTIISAAILLLLTAACGQVSGTPTSVLKSPSPSATTTVAPSSKPTSQATPGTSPTLLFAALEASGTANAWTYNTLAIVGLDGYARAKTTFAPIPNSACAVLPQSAHVAGGKVFFADSRGVIRSLAVDGTVATAATFPLTSTHQMLSFAVSPDGTRLLGTIFTPPADAMSCIGSPSAGTSTFDAYSATNGGPSKLLYHLSWTRPQDILALTGWDSVGPIGSYPTVWWSQGGGPGSTLGVSVRVDAATVKPGAQFSDPSKCQVWDSVSSGSFVCTKDAVTTNGGTATQKSVEPVSIRRADGSEMWPFTMTSTNPASSPILSPDTQHVAICCADTHAGFSYVLVGRAGPQVKLANGFYADGWLNSTTLIGDLNINPATQPPYNLAYVAVSGPARAVSLGFSGKFVGMVRG
jgi:hypothetical protein